LIRRLVSEREFVCEACGAVLDRDENAARNLARLAAGATGRRAFGQATSSKQERGSSRTRTGGIGGHAL
jgi:putative transposase